MLNERYEGDVTALVDLGGAITNLVEYAATAEVDVVALAAARVASRKGAGEDKDDAANRRIVDADVDASEFIMMERVCVGEKEAILGGECKNASPPGFLGYSRR